jgi:MFS-type transporter involved in bile tolerance (Atg22 family)
MKKNINKPTLTVVIICAISCAVGIKMIVDGLDSGWYPVIVFLIVVIVSWHYRLFDSDDTD